MLVRVGCHFEYAAAEPAPSLWQVRPRSDGQHRVVSESWAPPAPARSYLDAYGNTCERMTLPAGVSTLRYEALVEVASARDAWDREATLTPIEALPDEAFVYLLPSRFCWPDVVADEAWERFGSVPPGWAQVQAVCDWTHDTLRYTPGASTATTTAQDVLAAGAGVCRDYAQVAITFCRALNIPARYVGGYLTDIGAEAPDPAMDFCSWFEAWLGGRWWTFDPRNNVPRVGRVVVAHGRDALDAAMVTTWGDAELQRMEVWADEEPRAG